MNLIAVAIRSGRIMIGCVLPISSCLFLTCFVIYFAVSTSTASLNVVISPTFPGKITYGVRGNLLSSPVCHTGIPGLIWPRTFAFFTARAFVPTSLDVIPPFAITKLGVTLKRPTSDCTASEIFTDNLNSSSLSPVSAVISALVV